MHWSVETVTDDQLSDDWAICDVDGEFTVFVRESALDRDPGRITREVLAALRAASCPASLIRRSHAA